jgi:hypothetical protein
MSCPAEPIFRNMRILNALLHRHGEQQQASATILRHQPGPKRGKRCLWSISGIGDEAAADGHWLTELSNAGFA